MIAPKTEPSGPDSFAFQLNGGLAAGADARRALTAGDGRLPAATRADVLLHRVTATRVSLRVVRRAHDRPLGLEVRQWPRRVRVEVVDPGTRFTQVRPGSRGNESGGWGLFLVDRIADTWGVGRAPAGTCVWFEIEFEG